jgi:putative ABC transport system substrate-binding protein
MLCSSAEAQQSNKPAVVAFVRPGLPPDPFVDAFRQALGDLGHIEEKTVHIEYRWLAGRPDVLPSVAKELKNLNAAVIVTQGEVMTRPISDVTSTIPIVMATSGDPVGAGLVTSLAKPGGKVTGLSSISPDISGKRLQLLKEAAPNVSRVAVLYNPEVLAAVRELQEAEKAARALALTIQPIKAVVAADLPPSLDVIAKI